MQTARETSSISMGLSDLSAFPLWVSWDDRPDENGRVNKAPLRPNRRPASSTDFSTWSRRADAEAAGLGVGVVLGQVVTGPRHRLIHGDHRLCGLDLDSVRDPSTGTLSREAREIVERFGSYCEVSPSEKGVKVLFLATARDFGRLRQMIQKSRRSFTRGPHEEVALDLTGRYYTVTQKTVENYDRLRAVPLETVRWLLDTAGPAFKRGAATGKRDEAQPGARGADRDESRSGRAYRLAMTLHYNGATEDDFRATLENDADLSVWALDDRQVVRTWERAAAEAESPEAWRARIKKRFRDERSDEDRRRANPEAATDAAGILSFGGIQFLTPDQIGEESGRVPIVKGFLSEGDFAAIVGKPGCGKSVLAPHLAFAVAQGEDFFGMTTHQGGVVYVAAEDSFGMATRIQALAAKRGSPPNLHLVRGLGDLGDTAGGDFLALRKAVEHLKPKVVILDTLGAAFRIEDENDAGGMTRVIKACRTLTAQGCAVVLIAHSPKDESRRTVRGHGSLDGDLDVALFLERKASGVIEGSYLKNRNGPSDQCPVSFHIRPEEFGTDIYGDPRTVPTLVPVAGGEEKARVSAKEFRALRAVERRSMFATHIRKATVLDALVSDAEFSDSLDRDNRRNMARRALKALVDLKMIADDGENIRLITPKERRFHASTTPECASEGVNSARFRVVEGSKI